MTTLIMHSAIDISREELKIPHGVIWIAVR